MPITVNVVTGQASSALAANEPFVWVNPTTNIVTLTNCGGFCSLSTYVVPARTDTAPGEAQAQVNSAPNNWTWQENPVGTWNPGGPHPGMPHIQNPTFPRAEVA